MRVSWYSLGLVMLCGSLLGCQERPPVSPAEPSLAQQLADVRAGRDARIMLEQGRVGDAEASEIGQLDSLEVLLLDHAPLTEIGLKHLNRLPKLQHLKLREAAIDDEGAAELAKIESLQILNLPQAKITNDGLAKLASLPQLVQLRLGSPFITDAGLDPLVESKSLLRLHFIGVPITDEGLLKLGAIPQLESLYLDQSHVTDAGLEQLFKMLAVRGKQLHIHIDQQHHDLDPHSDPH